MNFWVTFLIQFTIFVLANGLIFSSTDDLEALIGKERKLINVLINFKASLDGLDASFVARKISEHEEEVKLAEASPKSYIYNPLNAYLLIQRLSASFELFEKQFVNDKELLEQLRTNLTGILQNREDLVGGVEGLLRLQKIYKLKSSDFAQGIVDGQKTRKAMKAFDLFIIGREASKMEFERFLAIEYLELAVEKFKSQGNKADDLDIKITCFLLAEVHTANSNFSGALEAVKFFRSIDEANEKATTLELQLTEAFERYGNSIFAVYNPFNDTYERDGLFKPLKETYLFGKACRGELKNTPQVQAQLKCRYHSASFFSLIAPFKMEEASLSPVKVSLFYNMITDREIEKLKSLATTRLKVGTIVDKAGVDIVVKNRITKTAFVFDREHSSIATISKRVEDMCDMTCKTAEGFQVQNYGIGGHYTPHWDASLKSQPGYKLGTGNRIATALFYMSDVEKGGYTIFPYLNIRVPPVKGLAVYWTNLQESGEVDFYTKHGSCPVLLGSKWVTNKWLHEFGQEFRKPCSLKKPDELTEKEFYKRFF